MSAREIIKRLFVVHKCAACRTILGGDSFDEALCPECKLAFRVASTESCPDCFRSALECTCQPKSLSSGGALCLRKLFFYHTDKEKEPQNRLVYFIKHHPALRASRFIASELWVLLRRELSDLIGDGIGEKALIVNVPRGRKAVLEYGFDQSAKICEELSNESGIQYFPAIKRKAGGREQKKLGAAERRKNINRLMYADPKYAESVKGRYVILFDDIVTTGASMESCLTVLRKMGAKGVICCCIAADIKKKRQR